MLAEGQMVGTYQLLRKLGEGAFGEVWAAKHVELDAVRAMKIPTDPDCVKQLRKEGKIQFDLKHPNIVETVDLNTHHDPPYYVMEYVEGQDLRKVLTARKKLEVPEALRILRQILDALAAAHAHGVLHRDLKPENVLVTADGTVKVADFGLGKVQSAVAQSLVLSGSMMSVEGKSVSGTYAYMSPEQQVGLESDPRDDVYAMGIIACELLTGNRPSGVGVAKVFKRAGLDAALSEMVEKALDEPAQRYANGGEMLAALRGIERQFAVAGAGETAAEPRSDPAVRLGGGLAVPPRRAPVSPPPAKLSVDEPADVVPTLPAVPARLGGASSACIVPRWRTWILSPGERAAQVWMIATVIMGMVVGGNVGSRDVFEGSLYIAMVVWIGCSIAVARARSRYHLACAEACLGSGDCAAGLAYARKVRRGGVDGSRARRTLEGLAALAQQRGDAPRARELGMLSQGWVLFPASGQAGMGPPAAGVPLRPEALPQAGAFGGRRWGVGVLACAMFAALMGPSSGDKDSIYVLLCTLGPGAAILYGWLTCRGGQAFWVSMVVEVLLAASISGNSIHGMGRLKDDDWAAAILVAAVGGLLGWAAAAVRRSRLRRKGLPPL